MKYNLSVIDGLVHHKRFEYKLLVIAGKLYLLVATGELDERLRRRYEVLDREKHKGQVEILTGETRQGEVYDYTYYVGYTDSQLIELSRLVGAPVFVIDGYRWDWKSKKMILAVDAEIPILAELGLPAIYKAEQLYQDLSYFMGNLMQPSPDLQPPVEVGDKDRIVQHGFDLKRSFRHRK
jgi:hypothetical protein